VIMSRKIRVVNLNRFIFYCGLRFSGLIESHRYSVRIINVSNWYG